MILVGEVIWTLDLVENITSRTNHMESGKVVIYIDNKQVLVEYNKQVKRESKVITEAARISTEIRNKIKKASINIFLEFSNNKPK